MTAYSEIDAPYAKLRNSKREHVLVLEIWADNIPNSTQAELATTGWHDTTPNSYEIPTMGGSSVAGSFGAKANINNSYIAISSRPVWGLATKEAMLGNLVLESSIGNAFDAEMQTSIGTIDVDLVSGLTKRNLEGKKFMLSVGYWNEDFTAYAILAQGKVVDVKKIDRNIRLSFSLIPQGTENLWPEALPYILGTVDRINPVKINETGLWQFHSDTVDTTVINNEGLHSGNNPPLLWGDPTESVLFHSTMQFETAIQFDGDDINNSTSVNTYPLDSIYDDGSVKAESEYIQMIVPGVALTGTWNCYCSMNAEIFISDGASSIDWPRSQFTFSAWLDQDATVESFPLYVVTNGASGFLEQFDMVITKAKKTYRTPHSVITGDRPRFDITASRRLAGSTGTPLYEGEDLVVNIGFFGYEFGQNTTTQDVQIYDRLNNKIPTFHVNDASSLAPVLYGAYFDNGGFMRAPQGFIPIMDAVGSNKDITLVAACAQISSEANGTQSPVTAPFTGPKIGYYANSQKPMLEHIYAILGPTDCSVHFERASTELRVLRRYNFMPYDFDGVVNDIEAWRFDSALDQIMDDGIIVSSSEPSTSNIIVRYAIDHSTLSNSKSESFPNVGAIVPYEITLDSALRLVADAIDISLLSGREGSRKVRAQFTVAGIGKDLILSTAGHAIHDEIKSGIGDLRKIRMLFDENKTYIEAVIYV
jgi:hypothetical protein